MCASVKLIDWTLTLTHKIICYRTKIRRVYFGLLLILFIKFIINFDISLTKEMFSQITNVFLFGDSWNLTIENSSD